MSELLQQLADKLGIITSFRDGGLIPKEYKTEDKIIKFYQSSGFSKGIAYLSHVTTYTPLSIHP